MDKKSLRLLLKFGMIKNGSLKLLTTSLRPNRLNFLHYLVHSIDMKLRVLNPDSTLARSFKGRSAYGLSDAFASVTFWGADTSYFNLEIEKTGKQYHAKFSLLEECKNFIKKANAFLGINYGTIRFVINPKTKKLISFERI